MSLLTRPLAGLILHHEHYGSHLDNSGKTICEILEKKNFEHAGVTLAENWTPLVMDGYPTVAEYIDPELSELSDLDSYTYDQQWFAEHVRTSQYCLQIVKCNNLMCCTAPRSSYFQFVPTRFMPGPIPLSQTDDGVKAPERSDFERHLFPPLSIQLHLSRELLPRSTRVFKALPYDLYNPSVQSELIGRICKCCNLYFASKVMLKNHMQIHKTEKSASHLSAEIPTRTRPVRVAAKRQRELMVIIAQSENGPEDAEWIDEDNLDLTGEVPGYPVEENKDTPIPICSLDDHFSSPWTPLNDV